MAEFLMLRLEGVLQSWGMGARFDQRRSVSFPTKSGVIGLIACAMGLERGDPQIEALDRALKMGVRADRRGQLMADYQTVTGERGFLFSAEGKKRVGEATILTPREYLEDACFTVALAGDEALLKKCADALSSPVWQIYLGRKSCVPVRPVLEKPEHGVTFPYESLQDALERHPLCASCDIDGAYPCEIEDQSGEMIRRDAIRESGFSYDIRRVRRHLVPSKG